MFAVVYIPQFSLQAALRHEPEQWAKPVALVDTALRVPVVLEMTEAAARAGVTANLTPTQAMARCPEVVIRSRSCKQEDSATAALLQCAYAFSPHFEATAPGVCTLDLRGLATVSGAEKGLSIWAERLRKTLANVHLSVAIGIAKTPTVARHAARWGKGVEIIHDPDTFIAALPVSALEPSSEVASILRIWGTQTVGELRALNQEALLSRLGLEALALFAAASSKAVRPLHLTQPPERFEESFEFEPEVETLEPLLFLLRRFVDQFSRRLELAGLAVEVLILKLTLETGQKLISRLCVPQPTRDPDVLFRALQTHLETVRSESPIKSVTLSLLPVEEKRKQLGLFETVLADPQQFQETLARVSAVLGPDRVGTPKLENSHRPDAFRLVPPDFENAPAPEERPSGDSLLQIAPIRRFRPAIKADVESDSKPVAIRCSIHNGKLKVALGPWRASGNWWEPGGWEREEWDATTSDGQIIRLVHQADGWFVEGVID